MNKFMKVTLAASAMLAMSLTLGCSSDNDDDKYCVTSMSGVAITCVELDSKFTAKECKATAVSGVSSKTTSSAPKGVTCVKSN